jgi:hypothetical protein
MVIATAPAGLQEEFVEWAFAENFDTEMHGHTNFGLRNADFGFGGLRRLKEAAR